MAGAGVRNGALMFRCPRSGERFDSGFLTDQQTLATIPPSAAMRLRCKQCGEMHEVRVAEGFVSLSAASPVRFADMPAASALRRAR